MKSTQAFEQSLAAYRRRRACWIAVRGSASVAVAALALLPACVWTANLLGNGPGALGALASAYYAALALLLAVSLVPLWGASRRVVRELERGIPDLAGRVETCVAPLVPGPPGAGRDAELRELLVRDALDRLAARPPSDLWPGWRMALGGALASAACGGLVWIGLGDPAGWPGEARRLWAFGVGFQGPSLLARPGPASVVRGRDLQVFGAPEGFHPAAMQIHVEQASGAGAESAEMRPDAEGRFAFRFAAVDSGFRYRVSAHGVSSPFYSVSVVDPPQVDRVALRYRYPEWTRLEPREVEPAEDVEAIPGTRIDVQVETDRPLEGGRLVVDGVAQELAIEGRLALAQLTVEREARFWLEADVAGEPVRLTREFAVRPLEDEAPRIELVRPARDRKATAIEEVTARLRASDDLFVERVDLHLSINGGEWIERSLEGSGGRVEASAVLELESIAPAALSPGDVIAYYATARDHTRSVQTELYFLEVKPFDLRYSQSQQAPQPGRGGGDDISRRQRQIVVATWNLVREPDAVSSAELDDRTALLERLQGTLLEQTRTLVERAQARGLDAGDAVGSFVEDLSEAADSMERAVELLTDARLEAALEPEQTALARLLRAESRLRERQISLQSPEDGGGGSAPQDLAELIEIEMDPSKTVYEQAASRSPSGERDPQLADAFAELEELARRQQRLADALARASEQPRLAQRWEQQSLRRDIEDLRRRLEQQPMGPEAQELAASLERAARAMDRALEGADPAAAAASAEAALGELDQARRRWVEARADRSRAGLEDLARRAEELAEGQRRASAGLRRTAPRFPESEGGPFGLGGLLRDRALAQERRELSEGVLDLARRAQELAVDLRDGRPEAAALLQEAIADLDETQVAGQLAESAAAIERGDRAASIADSANEAALERFERASRRALTLASEVTAVEDDPAGRLARSFAELRRRVRDAAGPLDTASTVEPEVGEATEPAAESAEALRAALRSAGPESARLAEQLRARGAPARDLGALTGPSPRPTRELVLRYRAFVVELERLELDALRLARDADGPRSAPETPQSADAPGASTYFEELSRQSSKRLDEAE